MKTIEDILKYFPTNICDNLRQAFNNSNIEKNLQEIRIRVNKPIILKFSNTDIILQYNILQSEILQILERICENSIYAYKQQICNGFITIKGGHRVGLTGECVIENGKIINIKYISSLNFRIAREVFNCSLRVFKEVIDFESGSIFNTLIVSPPGKGKTTILRDLVRNLSNGITDINFKGKTCGVVDERGEIAACYRGIPQNDVGLRTDVIDNVSKEKGIKILVRSMAPEIIVCDEIGSREDVQAIKYAISSGVKGIFTMHGNNIDDVKNNVDIDDLIERKYIQKVIFI